MRKQRKNRKWIVLGVLLGIIFLNGCADDSARNEKTESQSVVKDHGNVGTSAESNVSELEGWIGNYGFDEFTEVDETSASGVALPQCYAVSVYKENQKIYATFKLDGPGAYYVRANVYGDEEWISLSFDDYLPDTPGKITSEYHHLHKGEVLLSFRKQDGEILTYWGWERPIREENEESGKVYFEKLPDEPAYELG